MLSDLISHVSNMFGFKTVVQRRCIRFTLKKNLLLSEQLLCKKFEKVFPCETIGICIYKEKKKKDYVKKESSKNKERFRFMWVCLGNMLEIMFRGGGNWKIMSMVDNHFYILNLNEINDCS